MGGQRERDTRYHMTPRMEAQAGYVPRDAAANLSHALCVRISFSSVRFYSSSVIMCNNKQQERGAYYGILMFSKHF